VKEANRDGSGLAAGLEGQKKRYEGFFETLDKALISQVFSPTDRFFGKIKPQ
jgi:hypothetical protein